MIKEKLLAFLNRNQPRTGRIIKENGTIVNIADVVSNFSASNDIFGQINTAEYTPIVERKPLPVISVIRDDIVGAGAVSVVNGEIQIDATAGLTSLYTRDFGRYLPGLIGLAGIGVRFQNPTSGHYEIGYGNGNGNRFGLELDEGEWYTFIESGGVRWYRNPRSNWDDPLDGTGASGLTVDESQFVLRMPFGWYGYLSINWVIAVSTASGDQLITIDTSGGRAGAVTVEQPDLPIFAEATNGIMYVGGRQYGVYGRYNPQKRITCSEIVNKTGVTALAPIVSFRVKNTTQWRGVPISVLNGTVLATADSEYEIIIGGTLTGAVFADFADIDPNETALQVDTSATAISGGYKAYADLVLGGQGSNAGEPRDLLSRLNLPENSIVTLAVRPLGASTDVTAILRAEEEF